jgi:hypothetical protein
MAKPILKLNIKKVEKNLQRYLFKRMQEVVTRLETFVRNSMVISNYGGKNPSSPGDVPNIGRGDLKRSITSATGMDGKDVVGVYGVAKGTASKYAKRLELGYIWTTSTGKHATQMPRPFIAPAYKLNKAKIKKILTR